MRSLDPPPPFTSEIRKRLWTQDELRDWRSWEISVDYICSKISCLFNCCIKMPKIIVCWPDRIFNWRTEFEIYLKFWTGTDTKRLARLKDFQEFFWSNLFYNSSHWFFPLNLTEFRDLKYNQLFCAHCLEKAFRQLSQSFLFYRIIELNPGFFYFTCIPEGSVESRLPFLHSHHS